MGSTEEPERKRRHAHNSVSSSPKKQALPPSDEKKVDATVLQYENHKLSQQLDIQRAEIQALEAKSNQLKSKQISYDYNLASIQNAWEELVDNLELLSVRANAPINGLRVLQPSSSPEGSICSPIPPEEIFLYRLLDTGATESGGTTNGVVSIERALEQRQASTIRTIEHLVQTIDAHHTKNEDLYFSLRRGMSSEEYEQQLQRFVGDVKAEIGMLRSAIGSLHQKHHELVSEIKLCQDNHASDQVEMKRLKGDLEETLADLELSRRKLAALRNQKDGFSPTTASISGARENMSQESKELEVALDEAKNLASQRLNELKEVQKEKMNISEELLRMQDSLNDEYHIVSSAPYLLLHDQVQHLKEEVERSQLVLDESQAERDLSMRREKEALLKAEAGEAAQKINDIFMARISDVESNLEQFLKQRDELQARLEEVCRSSEKKDEVAEFKLTVSSLHKEMRMMQQQLNQYKEAACGAHALRAEVQSLSAILDRKTSECKCLTEKVADQCVEINAIKDEVRFLQESEQELKLILEMYGRESTDTREARELKQAECRAWAQVERLKAALDEHSLELRVKAAIEAEAACQRRLATAEAEIAELRQKLDASDRDAIESKEVLKMKSEEGEVYLAEIETIGQAYEDMQTQNQRLLQQISERDDYNLKLISESFKAKQFHVSILEEKQGLANRLQHVNSLGECYKQRAARLEEQVRSFSEQLGKAVEETKQHFNALEQARRKNTDAEKEVLSAKSSLEAAHKELEQQRSKMTDAQTELEKERFERKRIQEELAILSAKATQLNVQTEGGPLVEKLQEEIKEYKAILKCSVCHDRPKEVVITKCFHLFCSPCIQKNLEMRHRKCPGCGILFGQNDVRNVYI